MSIATIGDVLGAATAHPTTENCPHCKGTGQRAAPFLMFPLVCLDCKGTGKLEAAEVVQSEPVRPGLGDEIKPDLKTKRFRDW